MNPSLKPSMPPASTGAGALADSPVAPVVRAAADKVAHVLDRRRVDPIVGLLLPGVGDLACGLVGLGVVGLAAAYRVHKLVLARMLLNLAIAVGIGAIPLVGDAFDFWFRANTRNARLLARAHNTRRERFTDGLVLALAALGLFAAAMVPIVLLGLLVRWGLQHR